MNRKDQPLVSIGLPVHNGAPTIRRAVDSLLKQDYEHVELIMSDNASTDETPAILNDYGGRDHRVQVHLNETDIGAFANFKKTALLAQGKYFMWAADDDEWRPEFVSSLARELESHPDAHLAACAIARRSEEGRELKPIAFTGSASPNRRGYLKNCLGLISRKKYNIFIYGLFRTRFLQSALDYIPTTPAAERWFLCTISLATRIRYVNEPLYIRTVQDLPIEDRYPDDRHARAKRKSKLKLLDYQPVWAVTGNIWRAPFIPVRRKLYLPLVFLKLFAFQTGVGYRRLKGRLAPPVIDFVNRHETLKKLKERFRGSGKVSA